MFDDNDPRHREIKKHLTANTRGGMPALYFAGRIKKETRRWGLANWDQDGTMHGWAPGESFPTPTSVGRFQFSYVGPYAYGCDHGCTHGPNAHGSADTECMGAPWGESREHALARALDGIRHADIVFAWLEDYEAHGTVAEIGYAVGRGKPVIVLTGWDVPDLWFPRWMADAELSVASPAAGVLAAFEEANTGRFAGFESYSAYLKSDHWRETRAGALARAAGKCQLCGSDDSLNVHHNTYERLGAELPADLIVLCREHHAKFHDVLEQPEA